VDGGFEEQPGVDDVLPQRSAALVRVVAFS